MFFLIRASDLKVIYADRDAIKNNPGGLNLESIHSWFKSEDFGRCLRELKSGHAFSLEKFLPAEDPSEPLEAVFEVGQLEGEKVYSLQLHGVKPADALAVSSDYDESKMHEVEDRLNVSEKTMASIIELAVDGIIIIDQNGIVQGFNRAAEKMFGFRATDVMGKNVSMLMPEPHRHLHNGYIQRYLATGIPHIVGIGRQVEAKRKDGTLFPIDLAVGEVQISSGSLFTGFIRDLSETRKIESERNSFFQMSLDLFCILDLGGIIRRANSQWHDLMGYVPAEVEGHSLAEFINPADVDDVDSFISESLSGRNIFGRVMRFRQSDGGFRWILWNSTVDRENASIYGVGRDITEQKKILEELENARHEAERSSQARGAFIAKMSHEFRTPLNSIIGFSRHLQKNVEQNFNERELLYLDRIASNGNTLLKLVNNVLAFAKAEAGFIEVHNEAVDVVELVREVLDLMQVLIEEKQVEMQLDMPPCCQKINTDAIKLRQIIQNLVDNAMKFSADKPVRVCLKVDSDNEPQRLEIIDSGPGIAADQLAVIFEAFQQGDNSVARKYGGAGLGLSIARALADMLGFELEVSSQLSSGSCFSIVFRKERNKDE